jgi:hypothetical protein
MQELVDSIVRFSTAMSLFGVQQLQNGGGRYQFGRHR